MPQIEIRPAVSADIPVLAALDHRFTTEHVWQMEFNQDRELGEVAVSFRQMKLPRSVRVDYPRLPLRPEDGWTSSSGLLVGVLEDRCIAYVGLSLDRMPGVAWITDLVVDRSHRRNGIGGALVLAGAEWAVQMGRFGLVLEMQTKNHPAIQLASKLGFEFCGYNDAYYPNREIGIFFYKAL
jgi:ribosomal protein S18 acetylase RimI-like enzyme